MSFPEGNPRLQPAQPSRTALRVALRRAAHQIVDAAPRILDDAFAIRILGPHAAELDRTPNGRGKLRLDSAALRAFVVARSRYAEDILATAIAGGVTQYVLLGAGLDTFALRNEHPNLRVFEIDHPATQAWKRDLLRAAGLPEAATFVPLDFETESLATELAAQGHNSIRPTVFAWLGVVPYLTLGAFRTTVAFIAAQPPGTTLILDYAQPRHVLPHEERLARDSLAARVQQAGEPFQLFLTPAEIARELHSFRNIEELGTPEINSRYFSGRADHLQVLGSSGRLLSAHLWLFCCRSRREPRVVPYSQPPLPHTGAPMSRRALLCLLLASTASAQPYAATMLSGLHWRDVGPMRGGRSYGVAGVASQPDTFYFGSVGGGVWKTENAGRTWSPISDDPKIGIPIGSIGALAVAPSDPNVVYVGTGEPDIRSQHSYGDGMYKSLDAGRTWTHIGLEGTAHIGRVVVDPKDPKRVFVAALGQVYGPNPERGLYRSTDGGAHWKKILFKTDDPDNVGAIDIAIDPADPRTVYASLWATRRPPWAVYAPSYLPGSGLYKSVDGGDTWMQLGGGLPNDAFVGKIGIAVAPSNPKRLWAVVDDIGKATAAPLGPPVAADAAAPVVVPPGGVFLSDDAGATWRRVNAETRLWGRGWYFEQVAVDPSNADKAYVINTATYRTEDAGKTFLPVKGAPGGDDYHQLWINPRDSNRMVLSSDQGTVVSVDGAKTWSTWYNQPTAELYRISADNRFPYWLYGPQQDSGAVGVSTWAREGLLSFRNWEPICEAGESAVVIPDPKDGNILYGGGAGRCDQALNISVPLGKLPAPDAADPDRRTWTLPEIFSPADDALYYATQFVMRSRDRGKTWEKISPDLSRVKPALPKTLDAVTATDIDQKMTDRFGVVYSLAPSPLDAKLVWAGTDDGLLWRSKDDGAHWDDVTPKEMTAWSKVSSLEAGHFDALTAYASVDRHRLGDDKPYILRTHDGGRTWATIVAGIPTGAYVNAVREDPKAKGLLYAATELRVYVSFDDGAHWQPLQNNMPVVSIRDLLVHGDDLAIATHGRGFWVMDQMAALRELTAEGTAIVSAPAHLFKPGVTMAIRNGSMNGTPLPHEEPQYLNPPAGVLAYYWLKAAPSGPLKLELVDSKGTVRACAASDTPVKPVDTESIDVQAIWRQPAAPPSADAGLHRYALNPPSPGRGFGRPAPVAAPVPDACASTRPAPGFLQPGDYTVRFSVDGQTYTQPVTVQPDARGAPPARTAEDAAEDRS